MGCHHQSGSYAKNVGTRPSVNGAVLLNEVVMGNVVKLTQDDTTLTEPPNGADSVVGEVQCHYTSIAHILIVRLSPEDR
jgi:hypothetical protein